MHDAEFPFRSLYIMCNEAQHESLDIALICRQSCDTAEQTIAAVFEDDAPLGQKVHLFLHSAMILEINFIDMARNHVKYAKVPVTGPTDSSLLQSAVVNLIRAGNDEDHGGYEEAREQRTI